MSTAKPSDDKDHLARGVATPRPGRPPPPRSAGLLTAEPEGRSLADQRDELRVQIDEIEGALRFMGVTHPRRAETELRLQQLRDLVRHVEEAIAAAAAKG